MLMVFGSSMRVLRFDQFVFIAVIIVVRFRRYSLSLVFVL